MCKVSVIVPVYNAENHLAKCLESLINQTLTDIEIIIINDGSTDNSARIIQHYSDKYSNIKAYYQKNQGLFVTRQRGLEYSSGEYIGWVDADDFVSPRMFELLYSKAKDGNHDVVYCNYNFFPHRIKTKSKWFKSYLGVKNVDFVDRNSQPWNKIVKKSLLQKLRIGDLFVQCNDEAYIKTMLYAQNPASIDQCLYYYRVGQQTMSHDYDNVDHYIKFVQAACRLKSEMNQLCHSDYWDEYFRFRIIYYILMTLIVSANADDKNNFGKYKRILTKEFPNYLHNVNTKPILKSNFGSFGCFVIARIVPKNFYFSKLICHFVFK